VYSVYPVEEANKVFMRLSHSQIAGRAVLRVCSLAEADGDSVFFSPSMNQLMMSMPSGVYSPTDRFTGESSPPFSPEPMSTSPDSAPVRGATGNAPPPFFLPNTY
jgi:hypothetical protein